MIQHQAALGRDVGNSVNLMLLSLGWSTFKGMSILPDLIGTQKQNIVVLICNRSEFQQNMLN